MIANEDSLNEALRYQGLFITIPPLHRLYLLLAAFLGRQQCPALHFFLSCLSIQ